MSELAPGLRLHHVSRILHDEIGPALCAAGFHLELIRRDAASEAQAEAVAALQSALDHAVENVRQLSYEAAPDLAARHGLGRACRILAASRPWLTLEGEPPAGLSPEAAQALFDPLLDVLLHAGAAPGAQLALTDEPGWTLLLPAAITPLNLPRQAADGKLQCRVEAASGGGTRVTAAWNGDAGQEDAPCPKS